jgi:AraC family ethanolamine operon transcriptional activator
MYSHYYQYPNIGEICKISEVSERTLELAFKQRYGVSPLAFLNAIRLNTVYSILKKSVPEETKIGQIANKNGFWHMGKFAADYKKQFGELPSETLKKKPKMY